MARVTGLGGVFYKVADPDKTRAWYQETLGIGGEWGAMFPFKKDEAEGFSLFSQFKADTDYFAADRQFMINLRVDDLDAVLAPFREAGEEIITKDEWDDPAIGRFARVHDPDGNPIELWEPPKS